MNALIDGDRQKKKGRNQYTAACYVTDTHKKCSLCALIKEHSEFHRDSKNLYGRGLAYYCKSCANRKSRENHAKRVLQNDTEYKRTKRDSYYKNKHGITLDDFENRLKIQQNLCAICKVSLSSAGTHTHLDHDHDTNELRGILCTNCNRGLGHFKDSESNLMAAIKYLQAHKSDGSSKEGRCL